MHNVHYVHVKEMCACVKYYIEALGDRAVCCNEGGREREREREREIPTTLSDRVWAVIIDAGIWETACC